MNLFDNEVFMTLIYEIIHHFRLILILGKNDFQNKYLGSGLGSIWGFVNPVIQLITYMFVYQVIFKTESDIPFIVSFFPVLIVWMFLSETMISSATSIRNYSYLVKKIKFPIDIIPIIPIVSSYIVFLLLNLFVMVINIFNGFNPNLLLLVYMHISMLAFIIAYSRLFSALNTIIPDVSHFISSSMQVLFWISPILWSFDAIDSRYQTILMLNPLSYIIDGFRAVYIPTHYWFTYVSKNSLLFWGITLVLYFYGNYVFKKTQKEFADAL